MPSIFTSLPALAHSIPWPSGRDPVWPRQAHLHFILFLAPQWPQGPSYMRNFGKLWESRGKLMGKLGKIKINSTIRNATQEYPEVWWKTGTFHQSTRKNRCYKMKRLAGEAAHERWGYYREYSTHTSSTAQGGGGSFKNRKPLGEVGCCESRMAERIHWWWADRWLELYMFLEWLQWLQWSPHHNCWMQCSVEQLSLQL